MSQNPHPQVNRDNVSWMLRICLFTLLLIDVLGCRRRPEKTVRVQGTVTSIGLGLPVPSADVIVEWPAALKGGSATIKTDADGHYVAGRTIRADSLDCKGIVITVRKEGYASAYNQSSEECPDGVLTTDIKLFQITR